MSETRLDIYSIDQTSESSIPVSGIGISAGFPSPSSDFIEMSLDLNKELVKNPHSTFFARVSGVSMVGDGINDGDLIIVDKSIEPYNNCVAVCYIDGDFTLKRFKSEGDHGWLIPSNPKYNAIRVDAESDFCIWGVVRYVISKL